jgi:hypothetical protein
MLLIILSRHFVQCDSWLGDVTIQSDTLCTWIRTYLLLAFWVTNLIIATGPWSDLLGLPRIFSSLIASGQQHVTLYIHT